jgi:signal peptidase I
MDAVESAEGPMIAGQALEKELQGRRSAAQRAASRRVWWLQALTSLWAPITVLGAALVPYMALIELSPASATWAVRAMQGFGILMLVWFLALIPVRLIPSRFVRLRRLRHDAREVTHELGILLRRSGTRLKPEVREKLVAQAAAVDALRIGQLREGQLQIGEASAALEGELKKLSELADSSVASWRKAANLDFVWGFAKALLIALAIRAVLIEPYRIPSGSMIPTLQVGDQIFVNKYVYGVRIPWMNKVPFQIVRPPARGDVIVFNNPVNTSVDFVKRVVGIPGDVIEVRREILYVNGQAQPRQLLDPNYLAYDDQGGPWTAQPELLYRETLTGHSHLLLQSGRESDLDEGPYVVPPETVFVMGDNRDNSEDSRYGLGLSGRGLPPHPVYVPYGNIKGKAMIIWLSWSHGGLFSSLFGGGGIRTDRFFLPVR